MRRWRAQSAKTLKSACLGRRMAPLMLNQIDIGMDIWLAGMID